MSSRPPAARAHLSAGRGSLVQQAVEILLNSPDLATRIPVEKRRQLAALGQSGSDFLCELLEDLNTHPAQNAAQVLERFREHPYEGHLRKLAQRELLICDPTALGQQLAGILDRLIAEEQHRQRYEALITPSGTSPEKP